MVRLQTRWKVCPLQVVFLTLLGSCAAVPVPQLQQWNNNLADTSQPSPYPAIFSPLGPAFTNIQWAHILVRLPVSEVISVAEALIAAQPPLLDWTPDSYSWTLAEQCHQLQTLVDAVKTETQALHDRQRRGISVNLDIPSAISQVFTGISNLINAPTLKALEAKTNKVIQVIEQTAQFQRLLADRVSATLNVTQQVAAGLEKQEVAFKAWTHMQEAKDALRSLSSAAADVNQNKLPSSILMPAEAQNVLDHAVTYARSQGLQVPLTSLFQVYDLPASFFSYNDDWSVMIHVPMTDKDDRLEAYEFIPFPAMVNNTPLNVNHQSGLVAVSSGLPEDIVSIFVPDFEQRCLRFGQTRLCPDAPLMRHSAANCPAQMLQGLPHSCEFMEISENPKPVWTGGLLLTFFLTETDVSVTCPNQRPVIIEEAVGRTNISASQGCTISTKHWSFSIPLGSNTNSEMDVKPVAVIDQPKMRPREIAATQDSDLKAQLDSLILEQEKEDLELDTIKEEIRTLIEDPDIMEWTSLSVNSFCTFVVVSILILLLWRACKMPTF